MRTANSEFRYLARCTANGLTALLVLLSLASTGLWVRSRWATDCLRWDGTWTDGHSTAAWSSAVACCRGGVAFRGGRSAFISVAPVAAQPYCAWSTPPHWMRSGPEDAALDGGFRADTVRFAGFAFCYSGNRAGPAATFISSYLGQWYVQCPHWALVAATAVVPLVRGWRYARRRRRRLPGTCPACGYDLRASPDRCPECGLPR